MALTTEGLVTELGAGRQTPVGCLLWRVSFPVGPTSLIITARNIGQIHALLESLAQTGRLFWCHIKEFEGTMATRQQRQIVETPTEARQAAPGPSVLALLLVSTGLAVLILGVVWFVFFRA
jgi:hypothetical protein